MNLCPRTREARFPRRPARLRSAAVAILLSLVGHAEASQLLSPATGAQDNASLGTFVAEPSTPDAALFMNPAGLVRFRARTYTGSLGVVFPSTEVDSNPADYNRSDDRAGLLPSAAVSVPLRDRWRFAFGAYGSVGTVFDFEAEPPEVPADFVSDVSIGAAPLALAYEATPKLWVGVELLPLFGYVRNRYALIDEASGAALPVKYTLRGPGIQAMAGASWLPDDDWALGLSIKTPGMIWLDGSTVIGDDRVDVDLDLEMPTVVWGGVTRRLGERVEVSASLRWTDSSVFGDSKIEYASFSLPFVPDGKDEWRVALGAALRATERLTVRAGTAYASRIVGNKGVSPLLFDTEDVKVAGGASYVLGGWSIDVMTGYQFASKRHVSAENALILPGTYEASGPIVMLGTTFTR